MIPKDQTIETRGVFYDKLAYIQGQIYPGKYNVIVKLTIITILYSKKKIYIYTYFTGKPV